MLNRFGSYILVGCLVDLVPPAHSEPNMADPDHCRVRGVMKTPDCIVQTHMSCQKWTTIYNLLIDAIIFLKINEKYWRVMNVQYALTDNNLFSS